MTLRAYIDESYRENGVFVMAGYVSTVEKWAEFSQEWEVNLPIHGAPNPQPRRRSHRFKHSEMVGSPERAQRIRYFELIAHRHVLLGISCKIEIPELKAAMDRVSLAGPDFDFGFFRNPYFFTYRALMDMFHLHRSKLDLKIPASESVDFIFDERLKEKEVIQSSWENYVASRDSSTRALFGSKPLFLDDDEFLPLQAADLIAGKTRRSYETGDWAHQVEVWEPGNPAITDVIRIEFNEDEIVQTFLAFARQQTDAVLYDIRWNSIDL